MAACCARRRALAAALKTRGLRAGDKVALLMPNGYQTASLFLGAMIGGFVVTPLNLRSSRAGLAYALDHCDCKILFASPAQSAQLAEALPLMSRKIAIETIDVDASQLFPDAPEGFELEPLDENAPALLMYTSGTTGTPKGVLLTHRNLVAAAASVAKWHGLHPGDRVLSSLPLYHINGQVIGTLAPFLSGGSIVAPHAFSVSSWWGDVEAYRCTWINMVPTIIAYLLNAAAGAPPRRFPDLRFGRSASAPLPPEHHRAFEESFGVPVIEGMGMTESASVTFCNPMQLERRKYGSVGLPCGVEAFIADAKGRELPNGEAGEIRFRGPNVMGGYYKSRERTLEALDAAGFLRTGDLGFRDEDGFFFVTGRLKELIIKGGENIAPARDRRSPPLASGDPRSRRRRHSRRRLRPGDPVGHRAQAGCALERRGIASPLPHPSRPLQDAEILHLPPRAAEGPLREGAAARDCRGVDEAGLSQEGLANDASSLSPEPNRENGSRFPDKIMLNSIDRGACVRFHRGRKRKLSRTNRSVVALEPAAVILSKTVSRSKTFRNMPLLFAYKAESSIGWGTSCPCRQLDGPAF